MTCQSTREGVRCLHTEPHLLHMARDPDSRLNVRTWEDQHLAWPVYPFLVGVALLVLVLLLVACAPTHPEARHIVATTTTTAVAPTTTTQALAPAVTAVPRASRKAARPRGPSPSGAVATSGRCGGSLPPCSVMMCESKGDNTAQNSTSSASGKWQITRGTWNGYGGYPSAASAPESVQDDKARQLWDSGRGRGHWRQCL